MFCQKKLRVDKFLHLKFQRDFKAPRLCVPPGVSPHPCRADAGGPRGLSSADTDRQPPKPNAEAAEHGGPGAPTPESRPDLPESPGKLTPPSLADRKACSSHICHHVAKRETHAQVTTPNVR